MKFYDKRRSHAAKKKKIVRGRGWCCTCLVLGSGLGGGAMRGRNDVGGWGGLA